MSSCVQCLQNVIRTHKIQIRPDGQLMKVLNPLQFRAAILKLYSLVIVGLVAYIVRGYVYHPITVMGNYVYSRVASASLKLCGIPHVLCKGTGRIIHYETTDGTVIPFEGVPASCFPTQVLPVIPASAADLAELTAHTKIPGVELAQERILSHLSRQDQLHIADWTQLLDVEPNKEPIVQVRKFFGNLFFIRTANYWWITRKLIGDGTPPLHPGNILTRLFITVDEESHTSTTITTTEQDCSVLTETNTVTITQGMSHRVEPDLSIVALEPQNDDELIYFLQQPRPTLMNGIYTIHPFHFPMNYDPLLTVMTLTVGIAST